MFTNRIRLFRISQGLSQDQLIAKTGGIVSKQALSKYERGISRPSPRVLVKLAQTLGTKVSELVTESEIKTQFIAYRKGTGLPKKEEERVEALVTKTLEDWIYLQQLVQTNLDVQFETQAYSINSIEEVEDVAVKVRKEWDLGYAPIANLVNTLEQHNVFVVEINSERDFDGISAIAIGKENRIKGAAVVSRLGVCGERQRLSLAHELGHLLLSATNQVDEEKVAFRFGSAFIAPDELVFKEVGEKRTQIDIEELLILKKRLGLSLQAILYRLKDLEIINNSLFRRCYTLINVLGWKKKEPNESKPEKSQWLRVNTYRALSEGFISQKKAEQLLGEKIEKALSLSSEKIRAFVQLTPAKRNEILKAQAQKYSSEYEIDMDWLDMEEEMDESG
jgi:Zn-dependent peptidase ImmA (M78 family)/DNA-binding XRE family transcriptional regulator